MEAKIESESEKRTLNLLRKVLLEGQGIGLEVEIDRIGPNYVEVKATGIGLDGERQPIFGETGGRFIRLGEGDTLELTKRFEVNDEDDSDDSWF